MAGINYFDGRLTGLSKKETVDFDSENDYAKQFIRLCTTLVDFNSVNNLLCGN